MLTAPLLFWGFRLLCKSHSARTWHLLQPENLVARVFVGKHDQNQCSLNCCCAVESWGSYTVLFLFRQELVYAELSSNSGHAQSVGIQAFASASSFISVEGRTQDFVQVKKALYQLSYIPSPEIV